jgi:hypothetical protein
VNIAGVTNTFYNGSWEVAAVPAPTSTTFVFFNPTAGLAPSSGGGITSFSLDSGPLTLDSFGNATWDPVLAGPGNTTAGTPLTPGTYTLLASFSGDTSTFNPGFATLNPNQLVKTDATVVNGSFDPSVQVSGNSYIAVWGQQVTFTATIAPKAPGGGIPTGTVTFFDGAASIGTGVLDASGQASIVLPGPLSISTHSIKATYPLAGDPNFPNFTGPTTVPTFNLTVNKDNVDILITPNPGTAFFGQSVSFNASVTPRVPGGSGPATGTVKFYDGPITTTPIGSGILVNGSFTLQNAITNNLSTVRTRSTCRTAETPTSWPAPSRWSLWCSRIRPRRC